MGSMVFASITSGRTASEAFDAAVEIALQEHGSSGYTGTIAEKDSFTVMPLPDAFVGTIKEEEGVYEDDPLIHHLMETDPYKETFQDKWGPAVCIQLSARDVPVINQVGLITFETDLPDHSIQLAYQILSTKGLDTQIDEVQDLQQAIDQAKKLATNGWTCKVNAFYKITGADPTVFEAAPNLKESIEKDGLKLYLFTGYASC